jgi:CRISPR-associated protein Cas1
MQLVLDTKHLHLRKKNGLFEVTSEKSSRRISPGKLSSIAVTATVILHSDAIALAIQHQIPILFFDRIGKAKARLWSPYFASIATLRRQQVDFARHTEATAWMVDLFYLKTEGQIATLKYLRSNKRLLSLSATQLIAQLRSNSRKMDNFRKQPLSECRASMLGIEGTIARMYWDWLGRSLPRTYSFQGRSRRPAKDIFNAGLNYLYGMLYSVIEGGLFAAGLDPYLGLLHADEHKKPTLSFDLIEPFRPWVDRLLVEQCVEGQLKKSFFTKNQYGLFLNKDGKAFIIPLFNDFLRQEREFLGQTSNIRNHIYFMCGRLAQRIRSVMSEE